MTEKIKKLEKIVNDYYDKDEGLCEVADERAQWNLLDNEKGARGFLDYCLSSTAPADEKRSLVIEFLTENEEARLDFVKWLKCNHEDHYDLIIKKHLTYQNPLAWKGTKIIVNQCLKHRSDLINEYLLNDNDFALLFTEDCIDWKKNYGGESFDYIKASEERYEKYLKIVIDFIDHYGEEYELD